MNEVATPIFFQDFLHKNMMMLHLALNENSFSERTHQRVFLYSRTSRVLRSGSVRHEWCHFMNAKKGKCAVKIKC